MFLLEISILKVFIKLRIPLTWEKIAVLYQIIWFYNKNKIFLLVLIARNMRISLEE